MLLRPVLDDSRIVGYHFPCPGCRAAEPQPGMLESHVFYVAGAVTWEFNGDLLKPTFSPSLKNTWKERGVAKCCHLFLRAGLFEFCADCTHPLKGKSGVPMIPWPAT